MSANTPYEDVYIDWGNGASSDSYPRLCCIRDPNRLPEYSHRIFLALRSEYFHDAEGVIFGNGKVLTNKPDMIVHCAKIRLRDSWSDVDNHVMYLIETTPGAMFRFIRTTKDSEGIYHGACYMLAIANLGMVGPIAAKAADSNSWFELPGLSAK